MPLLHKNNWSYNISIKKDSIREHLSGEYSAKFNAYISMLSLHKNNLNYNFSIKQDNIWKHLSGANLLNTILKFQCYNCIKIIEITTFL